jgi:hypothetical protein
VKFSIAFAFENHPKYQTPQPAATSKGINQLSLLEPLPMARDIRLPSSANTQSGCDPNQSSGHKKSLPSIPPAHYLQDVCHTPRIGRRTERCLPIHHAVGNFTFSAA